MKKYYIGLLILGVLTLGLAGYVLNVGAQGKQDKQTYDKAEEIAEKLNNHISKEQAIPASLNDVGVADVPSTIKYERLSTSQYKFCVTYKTSRGYGTGDITGALSGAAISGMYGNPGAYESDYQPSRLYISYTYEKGENCQTVEPSIYNFEEYTSPSSADSIYETYCSTPEMREMYDSYCTSLESDGSTFDVDEL